MIPIDIDREAGFCFGVTDAIAAAEDYLKLHDYLYCLGDIVHNEEELKRLKELGLKIISFEEFKALRNETVLIRAHGEPLVTYTIARQNNLHLLDLTCPIVKKLQQRVAEAFYQHGKNGMVVIFGKKNHPEVIGLKGQVEGEIEVIEKPNEVWSLEVRTPLHVFSQTTKSPEEFQQVIENLEALFYQKGLAKDELIVHNSVCRIVARRADHLKEFVSKYDVILFVAGRKSSNGRQLFDKVKTINPKTYFISSKEEIKELLPLLMKAKSIGITGATSTSFRQMERIRDSIVLLLAHANEAL